MADTPVPGGVGYGAIKAPNNVDPGNRAANGSVPLSRGASTVNPPNSPADRRNGTMPLSGTASPIQPPNHRFDVGMAKMPQPDSANTPGKGNVPVGAGNVGLPVSQMRAKG